MRQKHLLFSFLIIVLIALFYSNTLHGKFFLDDFRNIHYNPHVKVGGLTVQGLVDAATLSPCNNRWLPNLSLALNYYFGGLNPLGYNLFNLFIHISTTVALYFLFFLTLGTKRLGFDRVKASQMAFAAAVLWGLHPLNTNGVSYVIQRMTSMAALFFVLSMVFYFKGRVLSGAYRLCWWAGAAAAGLCAFFSKENALVLPLVIMAYELFFFQNNSRSKNLSKRQIAVFFGVTLSFFIISLLVLDLDSFSRILEGYKYRDFTLQERLLTESRVVVHYMSQVFLPQPARLNLAYDFPISHSIFQPNATFFSMLLVLFLCGMLVVLFKRSPLISFTLFWFLFNLGIESTIIPLEIIFEHRMYLPDMFFFLTFIVVLDGLLVNSKCSSSLRCGVFLVIALVLGSMTWQRNGLWNDEVLYWSDVVKKSPTLSRAYVSLGMSHQERSDYPSAAAAFEKAIDLEPDNGAAWLDLGITRERQGDLKEALESYYKALDGKEVYKEKVYNSISRVSIKQGSYEDGLDWALKALNVAPDYSKAWNNLGVAYTFLGKPLDAEKSFQKAVALSSQEPQGYYSLALFLYRQKRFQEASGIAQKGISVSGVKGDRSLQLLKQEIDSKIK